MTDVRSWSTRLRDGRGRRVVFLSHCLLNQNTRYLGGATRAGCIAEIVTPCLERGIGIVQLPCPEEHAWGGVTKRRLLAFYGSEGRLRHRLRRVLLPLLLLYTRLVYRRLARQVASQVEDYRSSGHQVLGIVGVDGSPSCGVGTTIDVARAFAALGRLSHSATVADAHAVVRENLVGGRGLFVALLRDELERRGLEVPFEAHDLIREIDGGRSAAAVVETLDAHASGPR